MKTYKTERGLLRAIVQETIRDAQRMAPADFMAFLLASDPQYSPRWFHRVIAEHCQRLADGDIQRLMLFVPPQHGKSEIVSRKFPAWLLGRNPDLKIICASYAATLSATFSRSVQRLIDSPEYMAIFPPTGERGRRRRAEYFEAPGGRGYYNAVGVGGSLTGKAADIAIIDDPVKDAVEAYSQVYRDRTWEWYNQVLTTRLHNHSRQLFIMTRWHEDDLAGRILRKEHKLWTVLNIPALATDDHDGPLQSPRLTGDPLWPERHSLERLLHQRERAPRAFEALYQGTPTIEGGTIVRRDWFQTINPADFQRLHRGEPIHFYLDTAYNRRSATTDNDPTGILAAVRVDRQLYLLHAAQVWKEMPDLLRFLPQYMQAHGADRRSILHIEPKANGQSVLQMLRRETTINVKPPPTPTESKETRLRVASPQIECGRVTIVEGAWQEPFLQEVCGFPTQPHDEYVDILVYAIGDLLTQPHDINPRGLIDPALIY